MRERRVTDGDRVAPGDVLVVLRARDLEAGRDEARAALAALRQADRPQAQARLRETRAALAQAERDYTRGASSARAGCARSARAGRAGRGRCPRRDRAGAGRGRALIRRRARGTVARAARSRRCRAGTRGGTGHRRRHRAGAARRTRGRRPRRRLLLEIARDAPAEVLVPMDEKHLARVRVGQSATASPTRSPTGPFAATVFQSRRASTPQRGTVDVRLRIDPKATFVRQDMTATATIHTGRRDNALVVPNDALLDASEASAAPRAGVRDGRVQRTPVRRACAALPPAKYRRSAGRRCRRRPRRVPPTCPGTGCASRFQGQPMPGGGADPPRTAGQFD